MESEHQEAIYCADDDENRKSCDIFDKLCLESFYNSHLESGNHITITRKRQQKNNLLTNNKGSQLWAIY